MESKKAIFLGFGAVVLVVIGLLVYLSRQGDGANYDALATCIKDSGAKFYGAWWCPHCVNTKKLFGKSAPLLPYIECSTQDREELPVCKDAKIETFPTWVFPDGSRESGEMSLEQLADKTSCPLQ